MRFRACFFALLPLLCGCGDKSAVTLTAHIENVSIRVEDGGLGASPAGGFDLVLSLGPEAPRSATVSLGGFVLQTEQGMALLDPFSADPTGVSFPLDLNKGDNKTVPFTVNFSRLLTDAERQAVCAGKVRIVGSLMDSLSGGTDRTQSSAVTPSCP